MKFYHVAIGEFQKATFIEADSEEEAWKIARERWYSHFGSVSWSKYKHSIEKKGRKSIKKK